MFKRLLLKLFGKIGILDSAEWLALMMEGIKLEFDRVNDFKKIVQSAVVPNENMDAYTLDDTIKKYGLAHINSLPGITDNQKRDFCIEAAALSGYSGPDWIEDQLQKAGYEFYVHPIPPATDPATIPGELIVGTHPTGSYYTYTGDSDYWPFYFILSPFDDHIASVLELTPVSSFAYDIIRKLIINLKFQRDWCILQVDYRQYLDGSKYLDGSWYLDGIGSPYP